jgi:hypothetical protein
VSAIVSIYIYIILCRTTVEVAVVVVVIAEVVVVVVTVLGVMVVVGRQTLCRPYIAMLMDIAWRVVIETSSRGNLSYTARAPRNKTRLVDGPCRLETDCI